jgi:hypothetical protein
VRVIFSSLVQFLAVRVVYQAVEEKPNGCGVESVPGYLVSMSFCGAAQRLKLSESSPKLNFFDFHRVIINLSEGQKRFLKLTTLYIYDNSAAFIFGTDKQMQHFSSSGLERYFVQKIS